MTASVDDERCTCCGLCANLCAKQAIRMEEIAVVDPHRCLGCGVCVDACPSGALSLVHSSPALSEERTL